jgi:uncharacterized membrane protein
MSIPTFTTFARTIVILGCLAAFLFASDDAAKIAPIDKLSVVLVAIFAAAFLGERPLAASWAGISLIAAGATLIATGL